MIPLSVPWRPECLVLDVSCLCTDGLSTFSLTLVDPSNQQFWPELSPSSIILHSQVIGLLLCLALFAASSDAVSYARTSLLFTLSTYSALVTCPSLSIQNLRKSSTAWEDGGRTLDRRAVPSDGMCCGVIGICKRRNWSFSAKFLVVCHGSKVTHEMVRGCPRF